MTKPATVRPCPTPPSTLPRSARMRMWTSTRRSSNNPPRCRARCARREDSLFGEAHSDVGVTRVDIERLAGDAGCEVGAEKGRRVADVLDRDVPLERRDLLDVVQHLPESGDARRRQRLDRPCRNRVYPDVF